MKTRTAEVAALCNDPLAVNSFLRYGKEKSCTNIKLIHGTHSNTLDGDFPANFYHFTGCDGKEGMRFMRDIKVGDSLRHYGPSFRYVYGFRCSGSCRSGQCQNVAPSRTTLRNKSESTHLWEVSALLAPIPTTSNHVMDPNNGRVHRLRADAHCLYCSKVTTTHLTCATCRSVRYCSRGCQAHHWRVHKMYCKLLQVIDDVRKEYGIRLDVIRGPGLNGFILICHTETISIMF
jgi:hypothetical protein